MHGSVNDCSHDYGEKCECGQTACGSTVAVTGLSFEEMRKCFVSHAGFREESRFRFQSVFPGHVKICVVINAGIKQMIVIINVVSAMMLLFFMICARALSVVIDVCALAVVALRDVCLCDLR